MNNFKKKPIALSFDVEDWFTVRNMREALPETSWDFLQIRVQIGLDFILDSLRERGIKATFFVLGWIADKCPDLIKKIDEAGHEVGCHGYSHTPIDLMNPISFETDLLMAIRSIEKITGKKVKGYRAPSFSVTKKTHWSLEIIKKCGLEYDSSIFSTIHPEYGINNFPIQITNVDGVVEVPMRKSQFFGLQMPVCGGGYFRMLPYSIVKHALAGSLKDESLVMYFHPWEFDPEQPRVDLPLMKKFRHYVGLSANRKKFLKLLDDFHFTSIENLIQMEARDRELPFYSLAEVASDQKFAFPNLHDQLVPERH